MDVIPLLHAAVRARCPRFGVPLRSRSVSAAVSAEGFPELGMRLLAKSFAVNVSATSIGRMSATAQPAAMATEGTATP